MLLNYPPPTAVNIGRSYFSPGRRERQSLSQIHGYLHNEKLVHDHDLLLIVDGQDTWFQLPSDVIIKQYEAAVDYANARLLQKYGIDERKRQRFNQTIIFGAEKVCEGNVAACKFAPESILPHDIYGAIEGSDDTKDLPARYLNSHVVMGPAKELKALFDTALKKSERDISEKQTMQSILTTIFGEQQLRRDAALVGSKSATTKLRDWVGKSNREHLAAEQRLNAANATLETEERYEFSIGLDYAHTLFQPLLHTHLDEIVPLRHDNTSDLSAYRHPKTITPQLSLPRTLLSSKLPYWSPNLYLHNPSPETNKPAYIDKLEFDFDLDRLPNRHTPWSEIALLQNTYTGSVPALVLRVPEYISKAQSSGISGAEISYNNLWFAPYRRALLRQYFRTPQSPNGYHNSAVGGDRFWDQRGGRGGIWTSREQTWLPWGEVDGVCGTLAHMRQIFDDKRGVWMHETEDDNEGQRIRDEEAYKRVVDDKKQKDLDREKARVQAAAAIAKQEHEQKKKEKNEKERLEEAERLQKIQDERARKDIEKLRASEEANKLAAAGQP